MCSSIASQGRGLHSTMAGYYSFCQIPARDSQLVCLAAWHPSRLYLQQPLDKTDLVTEWDIYNSSISTEAGGEKEWAVQFSVVFLLLLLYLKCTHTHTSRCAQKPVHTPSQTFPKDVGPKRSLMFQFQSLPLARSNTWSSNQRWCHYPTAVPTAQRDTRTHTHAQLHRGQISLRLPPFNSAFSQNSGGSCTLHWKQWSGSYCFCVYVSRTHTQTDTHIHTQTVKCTRTCAVCSNSGCRE